jgi:integrase
MATFTQRKSGWYVQVRRKGHKTIGRTFFTKADAERWALTIEAGMGVGTYVDNRETLSTSLAECLDRYAAEIVPLKKGAEREMYRIRMWKNDPLAAKGIGTIKQVDLAKWRDERLASGISGSTVQKDLALLSHVFTVAIKDWNFALTNQVAMIRKPKSGLARDRRLQGDEETRLLAQCSQEMKAFIILAIETAMRRSEIVGLQRSWIKGRTVYLPDTKNGTPRAVPLSLRALEIVKQLPCRIDGKVFGFKCDHYSKAFLKACHKAEISDLHVHDLRREGCSRLLEKGLSIFEVKAISGHSSTKMLERYVKIYTDELFNKLDR